MIPAGGGRRILAILELFVKDHSLNFFRQEPYFNKIRGHAEACQQRGQRMIGRVGHSVGRTFLSRYRFTGSCPPRANRFPCAGASLFLR